MRQLNTISASTGLTVSVLSFIMVTIITIVLIIFCKVIKEKENDPNPPNQQGNTPLQDHLRPFSAIFTRGKQEDQIELRTDNQRETLTSDISIHDIQPEERAALVSDRLIPRSPTITRPIVHPRQVIPTDRHMCTIQGSHALDEIEVTHMDHNCPLNPHNLAAQNIQYDHSAYTPHRTSVPDI